MKHIDMYTDGSCLGNPGKGGWATILIYNKIEKELCGYEANTTNNRMELTAVIEGLAALKEPCEVYVYTDSKYVSEAINKGWLENWASKAFYGRRNAELWKLLYSLLKQHNVKFIWVKGHNGNVYNERCDALAVRNAKAQTPYKKMEFVSEKEALEWVGLNRITPENIIYTDYGVEVYYVDSNNPLYNTMDAKNYVIGALTYTGGTMYLTEQGTSFNIAEARRFTKEEASSKAKAMRKNSKRDYQWKQIKV